MRYRWGKAKYQADAEAHAIDVDKNDGNPVSACGEYLMSHDNSNPRSLWTMGEFARFGESREGKCKKCFKVVKERMQKDKRSKAGAKG